MLRSLLLLALGVTQPPVPVAVQPLAAVAQAAVDAARERAAVDGARVTAEALPLDPRLRLPDCTVPLTAMAPGSQPAVGRVTVQVSCAGARPWRVHVAVQVASLRSVVIAARPLARDAILAASDVALADREIVSVGYGYLGDVALAVGRRVKRDLAAGTVLTPGVLDAALVIRRGQAVVLEAAEGTLSVRMAGIAERDGAVGDRIVVQNTSSGRKVEGVVRSAKSVQVLLR